MTAFAKKSLGTGEDAISVVILLETEYPVLQGKVGTEWVEKCRN